jgi:hypothetical protein
VRKRGINPITIQPTRGGYKLTLGRLHLMSLEEDGKLDKLITAAMWSDENDVPVLATFDEDIFIDALGHLFPHGELDQAHQTEH